MSGTQPGFRSGGRQPGAGSRCPYQKPKAPRIWSTIFGSWPMCFLLSYFYYKILFDFSVQGGLTSVLSWLRPRPMLPWGCWVLDFINEDGFTISAFSCGGWVMDQIRHNCEILLFSELPTNSLFRSGTKASQNRLHILGLCCDQQILPAVCILCVFLPFQLSIPSRIFLFVVIAIF